MSERMNTGSYPNDFANEQIEDAERYEAFQNGTVVREDFANEHVRGSAEGEISFDMYPRQKGETPQQYGERLRMMHEVMKMAKEDAAKEELRKEAEAYAASKLGKYEAYLRAKQEAGVYKPEEVDAMLAAAKKKFEDKERAEARLKEGMQLEQEVGKVAIDATEKISEDKSDEGNQGGTNSPEGQPAPEGGQGGANPPEGQPAPEDGQGGANPPEGQPAPEPQPSSEGGQGGANPPEGQPAPEDGQGGANPPEGQPVPEGGQGGANPPEGQPAPGSQSTPEGGQGGANPPEGQPAPEGGQGSSPESGEQELTREQMIEGFQSREAGEWLAEHHPDMTPEQLRNMDDEALRQLWDEYQSSLAQEGENGEAERRPLRAVALSREMDARDAARDIAERMLKEDLAEGGRLTRFVKGIWKGNLFRGYYLGRNRRLAYERIVDKQNGRNTELNDADWSDRSQATIDRFLSEYEEQMIHSGAGEWRDVLGSDNEVTRAARAAIEAFARDPNMTEEAFNQEMARVKAMLRDGNEAQNRVALGDMVLDNYLDIARTARERFQHEESLEDIMEGFEIVIGEARSNVRTEAHRDALDRLMDRWEQGRVSRFIPPEIVGGAASAALWFAQRGATNLARIATAGFGGSAITGIAAGLKERNRVTTDRAQMARQFASGLELPDRTKYDQELAETIYKGTPATQLTEALRDALREGNNDAIRQALLASETLSRMSDTRNIDLITYSDPTRIEEERFALDLARAELRAHLRDVAPDALTNLDRDVAARMERLAESELDARDAAFVKLRRKRSIKMGVKTGLVAAGTMIAGQEVVAAFSPDHYGIADEIFKLNNNADAKMTWMAGVLGFENSSAVGDVVAENMELTPEQVEAYEKQGCVVTSNNVETITQEDITMTAREYADKYGVKVTRDDWGANGTKFSDGNELRAYYTSGGDGIVTGMSGNSVTWGGESINVEEALENGKIRAFVSLTRDGQMTPIEVTGRLVNGQMEFIPEPGSAAAACFENGKFIGKYFEVVYDNGLDANGVQHVIPLATIVGEGVDNNVFTGVEDVVTNTTVYDVVAPDTPSLMAAIPLPFVRRQEFTNGRRRQTPEPQPAPEGGQGGANPPEGQPAPEGGQGGGTSPEPQPAPEGGQGGANPPEGQPAPGDGQGGANPPEGQPVPGDGQGGGTSPEPQPAPEGGQGGGPEGDYDLEERREEDGYDEDGEPDWDRLKDQIGGENGLRIVRGDFDGLATQNREGMNVMFDLWWNSLSQDVRERFSGARGYGLLLSPESDALFDWLRDTGKTLSADAIYNRH